jgi:hypothetical protein
MTQAFRWQIFDRLKTQWILQHYNRIEIQCRYLSKRRQLCLQFLDQPRHANWQHFRSLKSFLGNSRFSMKCLLLTDSKHIYASNSQEKNQWPKCLVFFTGSSVIPGKQLFPIHFLENLFCNMTPLKIVWEKL